MHSRMIQASDLARPRPAKGGLVYNILCSLGVWAPPDNTSHTLLHLTQHVPNQHLDVYNTDLI